MTAAAGHRLPRRGLVNAPLRTFPGRNIPEWRARGARATAQAACRGMEGSMVQVTHTAHDRREQDRRRGTDSEFTGPDRREADRRVGERRQRERRRQP